MISRLFYINLEFLKLFWAVLLYKGDQHYRYFGDNDLVFFFQITDM